jgi:hypothetical protein
MYGVIRRIKAPTPHSGIFGLAVFASQSPYIPAQMSWAAHSA